MIYISGQVRCKLQGVCYIVSKRHDLWSTNGFKLDRSFYPPSANSAFHFIARLRWRRSANGTQPHFVKRWTYVALIMCRRNVGVVPPKKGAKNFIHLFDFSMSSKLNGEYLLHETRHKTIRQGRWKVRKVSYVVAKCHELWSTNDIKLDRSFYPPSLFCFVPVSRTPSMRQNVTPHISDSRWNGNGFDCSSDLKPQKLSS